MSLSQSNAVFERNEHIGMARHQNTKSSRGKQLPLKLHAQRQDNGFFLDPVYANTARILAAMTRVDHDH